MADDVKTQLISPMFRIGRSTLDVPQQYKENGKAKDNAPYKFGLSMILDPEALAKFMKPTDEGGFEAVNINSVCKELAEAKWPEIKGDKDKLKEMFRHPKGGSNWPIQSGETVIAKAAKKAAAKNKTAPTMEYLVGKFQINASSNSDYPPVLKYKNAGKTIELDREKPEDMKKIRSLFRAGGYAIAELTLKANETEQGYYVNFYVNAVTFRKEGDRIGGGGGGLMDRFLGAEGGETDFDPNADDFGDPDV